MGFGTVFFPKCQKKLFLNINMNSKIWNTETGCGLSFIPPDPPSNTAGSRRGRRKRDQPQCDKPENPSGKTAWCFMRWRLWGKWVRHIGMRKTRWHHFLAKIRMTGFVSVGCWMWFPSTCFYVIVIGRIKGDGSRLFGINYSSVHVFESRHDSDGFIDVDDYTGTNVNMSDLIKCEDRT